MKKIIMIILLWMLLLFDIGCSYTTNEIEAFFEKRSSFSGTAIFDHNSVKLEWEEIENVHQYQIFITKEPNDEFSDYEFVDQTPMTYYIDNSLPYDKGIYFYRIAAIGRNDKNELEIKEVSVAIAVKIE